MLKKKNFLDFRNPTLWLSVFALCSILTGFVLKWGNIPDRVEAVEKTTNQISDYIREQQILNKYLTDKELEDKSVICTPDGKFCWDSKMNSWVPRKEYENR